MEIYTSKFGGRYLKRSKMMGGCAKDAPTVYVDWTKKYQTHMGFGASFTEASALVLKEAGENVTNEAVRALFSKEGNAYNLGRAHINSCDFATPRRTYIRENDLSLSSFDLSYDRDLIVPLIKACERESGGLFLMCSPWSPPAFMKDNGDMLRGGKLLKKFYPLWADYLVTYLEEMEKCGVHFNAVNVQNEPEALQPWESCLYTAKEEGKMIKALARVLRERKLDAKIVAVDHNRDILVSRAVEMFTDEEVRSAVWGLAYHWYCSARHENLSLVHEMFPEKRLYLSESCVEYALKEAEGDPAELLWRHGERYGREIINDFNNYSEGWIDFNMVLNAEGGPNHVKNYCEAPLMFDGKTLNYMPSYYFIGHFSRFIRPGARRLFTACGEEKLYAVAYENPDGGVAVVMQNEGGARQVKLCVGMQSAALSLDERSIQTILL